MAKLTAAESRALISELLEALGPIIHDVVKREVGEQVHSAVQNLARDEASNILIDHIRRKVQRDVSVEIHIKPTGDK